MSARRRFLNGLGRALQQAEEQLCAVCLENRKEVPYRIRMPTPVVVCIIVVAMQCLMELQEQPAALRLHMRCCADGLRTLWAHVHLFQLCCGVGSVPVVSCCHCDKSAPLSVDGAYERAQRRAYRAAGALCWCAGWHMASEQARGGLAISGKPTAS